MDRARTRASLDAWLAQVEELLRETRDAESDSPSASGQSAQATRVA
jgi:hypothetical protein